MNPTTGGEEQKPERRGFLKTVGAAIIGGAVGAGAVAGLLTNQLSPAKPVKVAREPKTRRVLVMMWGAKPYDSDEDTPSIDKSKAGFKWQKLPIGPPGAKYATVHYILPTEITVNKGDKVVLTVINLGLHNHGFYIDGYDIDAVAGGSSIVGVGNTPSTGKIRGTATGGPDARQITFVADKVGIFDYYCNVPFNPPNDCNLLHDDIRGRLVVLE